ncbi:bacterial alpha-L-rhamnosidase-domain-containing protein [Aspergillus affinis]|uniref:bacterial alpha-L-rhamnosidase-domain-containing protein n=1 Tax=Aspergillus affinis TaxID=1070780 RepID=UPI0022FE3685|nr:bacterial alpha-L-rhamnosidase-domain-containing protein [Aspergillus affinis]KAI9035582.1 bacterial alpha-L-rhamnosidase-domain-containing protein [Aspergillus affinis]
MGPRGKLRYQSQPPVVLHNTFQPVRHQVTRPGITVFDLGQNSSIMVHLEVSGVSESEIFVRYSEEVGPEGEVYMADPLFKKFEHRTSASRALDTSRSKGPLWMLTIKIYPTIHADVNALINACYWTFSSNIFSYHTDCPQIEKFGWLDVTSLLAPVTQHVRDMEAVYSKILDDIIDTQESNGLVPTMAPETFYMCGPSHDTITWGCAICFLPQLLKQYYGSTHVFKKIYEPGARYMDYMRTKECHGGLIEHGLGDWGYEIAYGNHQANIETAVYYRCLQNMALMARDLDLIEDAARYEAWAARIFDVYNRHLLVPNVHRDDVISAFVATVEESGPRGYRQFWHAFLCFKYSSALDLNTHSASTICGPRRSNSPVPVPIRSYRGPKPTSANAPSRNYLSKPMAEAYGCRVRAVEVESRCGTETWQDQRCRDTD